MEKKQRKSKHSSVSLQEGIIKQIDVLIKRLGYWPSRSAFAREACLEKIRKERWRLRVGINHDKKSK